MLHRKKWLFLLTILAYVPIVYSMPTHPRLDLFASFILSWIAIEAHCDHHYDVRMLVAFGALLLIIRQDMVSVLTAFTAGAFFAFLDLLLGKKQKSDASNTFGTQLLTVFMANILGLAVIMIWDPYGWAFLQSLTNPEGWPIYLVALHVVAEAMNGFFARTPFLLFAIGIIFVLFAYFLDRYQKNVQTKGIFYHYPWQGKESIMLGLLCGFVGGEFFFGFALLFYLLLRIFLCILPGKRVSPHDP